MPEKVAPGPVHDARCIREAVCIDTKKIFDSCKEEDITSLSLTFQTRVALLGKMWYCVLHNQKLCSLK